MIGFIRTKGASFLRGAKTATASQSESAFNAETLFSASQTSSCARIDAGPRTGRRHSKIASFAESPSGLSRILPAGSVHTSAKASHKPQGKSGSLSQRQRQGGRIAALHTRMTQGVSSGRTSAINVGRMARWKVRTPTTRARLTFAGFAGRAMCDGMQQIQRAAAFRLPYDFTGQQATLEGDGRSFDEIAASRAA